MVATLALVGVMLAFAVCALLLNEADHAAARRKRRLATTLPVDRAAEPAIGSPAADPRSGQRLPVGGFLFGVLYLRGSQPWPFSELADAAGGSGMDVGQVLGWIERAEAGGLVERVEDDGSDGRGGQPGVRLTPAGMAVARNDRRSARRSRDEVPAETSRAPGS